MKRLTIVVPEGDNNLSSITGTWEIFHKANTYREERGLSPVFELELAGVSESVSFSGDLFMVRPGNHISNIARTDLIIVPSLNHNYHEAIEKNGPLMAWLAEQYRLGAEIASVCTGAFLLAAAGLLEGKACSTHWSVTNVFRSLFPDVRLQADRLITHEQGIYTNGGAYSFLNLILYMVEKFYDRQTAIYCSKVFQIDIDRSSQSEFSIFTGQKKHDDELVSKAQTYIEEHVTEKITVEALAAQLYTGRRNFDRRFIKATGNTPLEYAQRVKVEAAKKAFETNRKTIREVMFEVGYSDVKAFREIFRRITGLSPLEYKRKYHKDSLAHE